MDLKVTAAEHPDGDILGRKKAFRAPLVGGKISKLKTSNQ